LDKQFIQIFKKVINDYGLDICNNEKKLNSLLADYSKGEYYKERHLIVWVLEANKNNVLKINTEYYVWKNQCIINLYQNEFIDKERADWALDIIFELLFSYKYYLNRGFYLIDNSRLDEANISFDNALKINQYSAEAYHGKGIVASKNNDNNGVIEYFEKSIFYDEKKGEILYTSLARAYSARGDALRIAKKYALAIDDYTQSLKHVINVNVYENLASCYHELSDFINEKDMLNKAINLKNDNINLILKHGKACFQLMEYKEAISDYSKILNIDDTRIDVYELRAQVYYNIDNFQDAINDNYAILKIEQNNITALYHIGLIYYTTNDITKSQEYLNKINEISVSSKTLADKINSLKNKINIKNAEIFEEKGDKYGYNKNTNEAIDAYTKAINFTPNKSKLYFKRCYLYIAENNHNNAYVDLSNILKYSSEEYEIFFANGFICYFKNEYNKSLDNFIKLLKLKPLFSDYLNHYIAELNINLGKEFIVYKNYEKAIKYLGEVIKYDNLSYEKNKPLIADTYNKFGDSLFANNDNEAAIINYEKSLLIMNNNSIYFKLAQCYHVLADYKSEFKVYDILISIDPSDIEIYIKRSKTYLILKEYNKALNDYNIILKYNKNNIDVHFECLNIYILQNDLTSAQIECDDILEIEQNNKKALYIKQIIGLNSSKYFSNLTYRRKEWEGQNRYIEETKFDFGCPNCIYLHNDISICEKMKSYNAWPFTKQTARCQEYIKKKY